MSKKNKGRKVDITEFLAGASGDVDLPKAPSGQPREERRARYPEKRGPFGDDSGGASGDADEWRRGDGGDDRRRDGEDRRRGGGFADGEDRWRRGRGDDEDEWRRAPKSMADEEGDWRAGAQPREAQNPRAQQQVSEADSVDTWRRTPAQTRPAAVVERNDPLAEDNWRRGTAKDEGDWRKGPAKVEETEDDGRPRLKLKPKAAKEQKEQTDGSKEDENGNDAAELAKVEEGDKAQEAADENAGEKEENADKWDKIFGAKNAGAERPHRMYGDLPNDSERERVFQANAGRGGPRQGSHAFGSNRRGPREDEIAPPPRSFPGRPPRDEMPRRDFPGGGGGSGRGPVGPPRVFPGSAARDPQRDLDRQRAAMVFGGGRRDRERGEFRDEPYGGGASSQAREEYVGGMERFNSNRTGGQSSQQQPTKSLADMSKLADAAGDWGSDDEDKPSKGGAAAKPPAAPAKLSEEELLARTEAMLKAYLLLENKREAINAVKSLNSPEFMPQVVRRAIMKTFDDGSVKECKLIVSLLSSLSKESLLSPEDIGNGLDLVCTKQIEQTEKDGAETKRQKEKTAQIKNCCGLLKEFDLLRGVALSDAVKEIGFSSEKKGTTDSSSGEKTSVDEELLSQLLASGELGTVLAGKVDKKNVSLAFGSEFLDRLLKSKPTLLQDDPECSWLNKDKYGALLSKTLFDEDPDKALLKIEVEALVVIQTAFKKLDFPRAANGQAIIEKVFMKLYNDDILPPAAIVAWKDDLSDTPGKMEAIVQLSQFVNWLEADDDDEDDDE